MNKAKQTIGEAIFKYRATAELTQGQLAERTKLSANYICQIEGGQRAPSIDAVNRIAVALGIPLRKLIGEDYVIRELREKMDLPAAAELVPELRALMDRFSRPPSKG